MSNLRNTLNDILLQGEILSEEQLNKALETQKISKKSLLEVISDLGYGTLEDLHAQLESILELQYGVSFVRLSDTEIDTDLLNIFTKEILVEHKFIPIKRSGNIVTFGMVEPDNIIAEHEIKYRLRDFKDLKIKRVVILEDDFKKFIDIQFPEKEEISEVIELDTDELLVSLGVNVVEATQGDGDIADISGSAQEAPIIQLANTILSVAIKRGVSDIHVEPGEKEVIVRYRQDGVLSTYKILPKKIQNALISRYKIMSELDISERRLPQDGRIRVKIANKFIDFRVSTLPGKFGEKVVMRILDKSNISLGLDQIITNTETLKIVREMISKPYGIIYVTGPTGSGKTTTLYSALSERNTPDVNISTAEDPIEYDLTGITQSEVNKTIGLDFARILKAFLRQDPDIMLVGETRDKETAKIAVEAALTGHLVFTTLHTNDAPGSIIRLEEMGVEPFLISSTTIGIIAQRLLRKLCVNCKEAYQPEQEMLDFLGIGMLENKTYYRAKGCEACNNTGYKGRIGAYEVMKINDQLRNLIAKGTNTSVIKFTAQQAGMKTLLEYSLELAQEGLTTLEEVIRVTLSSDDMSSVCPGCGKPVGDEFLKCPFCQYELKKVCPRCKSLTQEGWVSCAKCGLKLTTYEADTICKSCHGEVSLEMSECPWCCVKIS